MIPLVTTLIKKKESKRYNADTFAMLAKQRSIVQKINQDRIFAIDGREGSGKSVLALQLATELDPTFCLDRVAFNANELENIVMNAEKYQAVIFDEAFNGLSGRSALSKENKRLLLILQTCRQRNLFIFLVLPTIFLLDKYAAVFRCHALFHVSISRKDIHKRYYKIYNYHKKKILYEAGKQYMSYKWPINPKCYRFFGQYPENIPEKEYLKKKLKAFQSMKETDVTEISKHAQQRDMLLYYLVKIAKIKQRPLERWLKEHNCFITNQNMSQIVKNVSKTANSQMQSNYNGIIPSNENENNDETDDFEGIMPEFDEQTPQNLPKLNKRYSVDT